MWNRAVPPLPAMFSRAGLPQRGLEGAVCEATKYFQYTQLV